MSEQNVEGRTLHPWSEMAQQMEPGPMPSIIKWDTLKMPMPDGAFEDVALLTIANPAGITTVFLTVDDLDATIANAQEVRAKMSGQRIFLGGAGANGIDLSKIRGQ